MRKATFPYLIWIFIFTIVPLFLVLYFAFTTGDSQNFSTFQFSLENFKRFLDPVYINVLIRSIRLAFVSTILCLIVGFPIAYIISREKPNRQNLMILMFVIPMWMNFLLNLRLVNPTRKKWFC